MFNHFNELTMKKYKRVLCVAVLVVAMGSALGYGQESLPDKLRLIPDEPAWVEDKLPKLDDRIWHAKPADPEEKLQPLKRVRVVDYGDNYI